MNSTEGMGNFPRNGQQGEPTPTNRALRRQRLRGIDPIQKESVRAGDRLRVLDMEIHQLGALIDTEADVFNRRFSRIIFEGKPLVQRYLSATRLVPSYLNAVYRINAQAPYIAWQSLTDIEQHDIFNRKVGANILMEGTSLSDIEQMPLTASGLLPEDIGRINRMFYTGVIFYRMNPAHHEVREVMLYQATQKFARPEDNIVTPKELQPLDDRLTAFFDYYTGLMTNYSLTDEQELNFYTMLALARPWLVQAIGCYLPARLGITPSSAMKLYREKGLTLPGAVKYTWDKILTSLDLESQHAVKPGRLPKDLDKFQHFDGEIDKEAEKTVGSYDASKTSTGSSEQLEQLLDKVNLYKLPLYKAVMRSRDRHVTSGDRLNVPLPDHCPAERMLVTAQYPQTMMLILPFNEGSHLTLELGGDHNLYGLPPKLAYDNPHLSEAILFSLLPPLIESFRLAYPNVEREARPADPIVIKIALRPQPIVEKPSSDIAPVYIPSVRERAPRLPKRLLTPLSEYLAGPRPLAASEEVKPQNFVSYNRSEVVAQMSRNIPERIIDQVMRDIRDFEYGRGDFKKLTGLELWEIRSGNYRVVLIPGERNTFQIVGIVDRKDLDKLLSSL